MNFLLRALLVALPICPVVLAQDGAGTGVCTATSLNDAARDANPAFRRALAMHERAVRERVEAGARGGGGVLTIPIVVHVVHDGGAENLSDATVIDGIAQMNEAFANSGNFHSPDGYDTGIQFCLAQRDPQGLATTGIEHIQSTLTDLTAELQDTQLKALSHWDPLSYVNLYVVREITSLVVGAAAAGYAYLPGMHGQPEDGIVVESIFLGGSTDNAKVTVHELGHYLGLYHTFEGACANFDCLSDGDRVCDTPPDDATASVACVDVVNSCTNDADDTSTNNPFRPVGLGGLGDQNDEFRSYMDYGNKTCQVLFTKGQGERMEAALLTTRASLLASQACLSPCAIPFNAGLLLQPASPVPVGSTVDFVNLSPPATSYLWELDGSFLASTVNASATFPGEGFHAVHLVVEDSINNCIDDTTATFEVDCPGEASFTVSALAVLPGDTVVVTNTSSGGGNYQWYFDGAPYSTATDLLLPIPGPGAFTLYLTSTTALCTNTSTTVTITTGTCANRASEMHWYFGDSASIDFNSGNPVAGSASAMFCREGNACISDASGDLLFYTNGLTIWDRTHQVMANGSGLLGGTLLSSINQALILPWPGSSTVYCVITMDELENNYANGVRWSQVDMTLNGGLGAVTLKNQFLHDQGQESMAATYHANGTDIWVLFPRPSPARIELYLLTANGFQAPIITVPPNSDNIMRPIFSHSGKRLAITWRTPFPFINSWHLLDFDPATGALSNQLDFPLPGFSFAQACEFSPNDQVLYMSDFDGLHQYDLTQTTASAIQNSQYTLNANITPLHVRLAPNGKIYDEAKFTANMASIEAPNNLGAACAYTTMSVVLSPGRGQIGLPLFVRGTPFAAELALDAPDTACVSGTAQIAVQFVDTACAHTWYVNDSLVQATLGDTVLVLPYPGVDSAAVRVVKACPCGYTTGTRVVHFAPAPAFSLGPDTVVCAGQGLVLDAGPASAYSWYDGSTQQTATITAPSAVWVEITTAQGCVLRDTLEVGQIPLIPPVDLGPNDTICAGAVAVLDAGPGYLAYQWHDLSMDQTFTAWQTGTYWVTVLSACGTSTDTIAVIAMQEDLIDLGPDPVLCSADPITLTASGLIATALWNDGSADTTLVAAPPGVYWVEVTDDRGCAERDSITLTMDTLPPMLICPPDTTVFVSEGDAPIQLVLPVAVATDDCAYSLLNDFTNTGDASGLYPAGTTTVTWTATDELGNTTTCDMTVLVDPSYAVGEVACATYDLSVAPNPNDGSFTLRITCAAPGGLVCLVDALGRQVSAWEPVYLRTHAMAFPELAPGHYTLRMEFADRMHHVPVLITR
ncbi:MAG: HYR domain-containing protein [Flavobacteriales bacterium]|nr:HYR domain-containing protein [Flavobacteriales bacterium]